MRSGILAVVTLLGLLGSSCFEGAADVAPPTTSMPALLRSTTQPPAVKAVRLDMEVPRAAHTATRLIDGRVLIAGGCTGPGCSDNEGGAAAEFFDPFTDQIHSGPDMRSPRAGHTATLLADGRVLITGGFPGEGRAPLATAEMFDPSVGSFREAGSMASARGSHTASLLPDGRVLVVGGTDANGEHVDAVELYVDGAFVAAAPLPLATAAHAAVVLGDGSVLVAGGRTADGAVTDRTVRYLPESDTWVGLSPLHDARHKHALVAVTDGRVFAVGGSTDGDSRGRLTSVEVWDPRTEEWTPHGALDSGRFKIPGAVVALPTGDLFVAGDAMQPILYDSETAAVTPAGPPLRAGGMFTTATLLIDGRVLIAGGYDDTIDPMADAYVYSW